MSKKKYADNNPKTLIGSRKVNLFTVPPVSIIQEATAMQNGASKYGPYNWRGMGSTVAAKGSSPCPCKSLYGDHP